MLNVLVAMYRLLLAGLGLGLTYLAIFSACWNVGISPSDIGFTALIPGDPNIVMKRAIGEFRAREGRVSSATRTEVKQAARHDPLEDEPLFFAAMDHIAAGEDKQATRLLEEARRRDPRVPETRVNLLGQYLKLNQSAVAAREIGAISRLLPGGRDTLVAMLANLLRTTTKQRAVAATLPSNPLRKSVLNTLAQSGTSASLLLDYAADMKGSGNTKSDGGWASGVIEAVASNGDIAGAKQLWKHFYALDGSIAETVPFDGEFSGIVGPPFGWRVIAGPAGLAEIAEGELRIQYFGRERTEFARQLLVLAPGSYKLDYELAGKESERLPDLAWKIACREGGSALLDLPLRSTPSPFAISVTPSFSVPADDCSAQWLVLQARPSLEPVTSSVRFRKIRIEQRQGA